MSATRSWLKNQDREINGEINWGEIETHACRVQCSLAAPRPPFISWRVGRRRAGSRWAAAACCFWTCWAAPPATCWRDAEAADGGESEREPWIIKKKRSQWGFFFLFVSSSGNHCKHRHKMGSTFLLERIELTDVVQCAMWKSSVRGVWPQSDYSSPPDETAFSATSISTKTQNNPTTRTQRLQCSLVNVDDLHQQSTVWTHSSDWMVFLPLSWLLTS